MEHWIKDISFAEHSIDCACEARIGVGPPAGGRSWPLNDPDQPLVDGWNAHLLTASGGTSVRHRAGSVRFWEAA